MVTTTDEIVHRAKAGWSLALRLGGGLSNIQRRTKNLQVPWIRVFFFVITLVPTVLTLFYALTTSAPLYKSETQFTIEDRQQGAASGFSGLMASIGIAGGSEPNSMYSLRRFIQSSDALEQLEQHHGFRKFYASPNGDWVTRLRTNATPDDVLGYYSNMVTPHISSTENIMTLEVWAFDPETARDIATNLLQISENFVNRMNNRALKDQVAFREKELANAQERLLKARVAVTEWRNANGALDPMVQAQMIQGLINGMEAELSKVRADISQLTDAANAERFKPRIQVLQDREASLLQQIANTRDRLTGSTAHTVTTQLADYEKLQAEMEFSQKNLELSMAALESARQVALQKQKYLILISSPTLPSERIFPLPGFHTLLVLVATLLLFGITVLLHSIVRDYRSV
ncbi:capsular polysaccharide transport system permease protein [Ciceribacter lividus]|uniref:Capsular polysaccharide transport system permease protein n=1 Tax=Ciceribacter lividus TaxID=1197950 RepID=A0A6I7HIP0_9HYPH|nr:hypothetical protein [Ciceribacter lividus]RCW19730.1 capsular polysaccharide transport system permease protein [Ciceribacter lividus]